MNETELKTLQTQLATLRATVDSLVCRVEAVFDEVLTTDTNVAALKERVAQLVKDKAP